MNQKQLYYYWTKHPFVIYKFMKLAQRREFATITPKHLDAAQEVNKRYMKITNMNSVTYHFQTIRNKTPQLQHFYISTAHYTNGIPHQPMDKATYDDFTQNHESYVEQHDFLIDIDNHAGELEVTHDIVHADMYKIHQLLMQLDVKHEVLFTGNGYHLIIPYHLIPQHYTLKHYAQVARWLKENVSVLVDHKVYDQRRIRKIPYSLSFVQSKTYLVHPLQELANHQPKPFKFVDERQEYLDFQMQLLVKDQPEHVYHARGDATKLFNELLSWE